MNTIFDYKTLFFDSDADNSDASNSNETLNKPAGDNDKTGDKPNDKEKKYSDDDLNAILDKKFKKWQQQKQKEIDEAAKLANMNAQEKAEHERDQLKAELDELKRANTRAEMESTARGILQESGVNIPDNLIKMIITDEADSTSKNVKDFIKSFNSAVTAEVKNKLSGKAPQTGTSNKSGITKADILKEKNNHKRQALMREHPELFPNLKI